MSILITLVLSGDFIDHTLDISLMSIPYKLKMVLRGGRGFMDPDALCKLFLSIINEQASILNHTLVLSVTS